MQMFPREPAPKQCFFCTSTHKFIDYKDPELLRRYMSSQMKIVPRRRNGLCASHQRELAEAIKRSRFLALVPFTLH
jgi:small subunit ribosomal protein S18